ncbi:MAG: response regulator [Anaerolineales bacterium]
MPSQVLVAEDEADMLWLIARRIENLGHQVTRSPDGEDAMHQVLRSKFDLVVTDINMPGASGLDILAEVKDRDPYAQVIIVTANATMENAIDALNRGAFSYLTKPFDHISVISNAVERALEYRRLQLDNLRMAEAQRRRGDMLEDEVTDRLHQISRQENAYQRLLANLPQGIIVASSNGRYLPRNPPAERWLAADEHSQDQPIRAFLESLRTADGVDVEGRVRLAGRQLQLRARKISSVPGMVERLVTIDDLSDINRVVGERIGPVVAKLAQALSQIDIEMVSDRGILLDMSRQVRILERITNSLANTPAGSRRLPD